MNWGIVVERGIQLSVLLMMITDQTEKYDLHRDDDSLGFGFCLVSSDLLLVLVIFSY